MPSEIAHTASHAIICKQNMHCQVFFKFTTLMLMKTNLYRKPVQFRAIKNEQKFLNAFQQLLADQGYKNTTIDQIADKANLSREAFLSRFGSKHQALTVLYEQYCHQASEVMAQIVEDFKKIVTLSDVLSKMSFSLEALITEHFAVNRAMHEEFMDNLRVHDLTKEIFLQCVKLMHEIQHQFLEEGTYTKSGAFSAAQLLITINFNHVLQAMPALPQESTSRHGLIANILEIALKN